MERIVVRGPDGASAVHPLEEGLPLVVGRDETCDVVLSSLVVSRRHAQVTLEGGRLFVEDLGSRHGTTLDDRPVTGRVEWSAGVVRVGEYGLERRVEERRTPEPAPATLVGTPDARLVGLGPIDGRAVPLTGADMLVGREAGAGVWVDDDSVSRRHARLRRGDDGRWTLADLGSANGTFVDGRRLDPGMPALLVSGAEVGFGETRWRFDGVAAVSTPPGGRLVRLVLAAVATLSVVLGGAFWLQRASAPEKGEAAAADAGADVSGLRDTAQRQLVEGRYADAVATLDELVHADPLDPAARASLASAKREMGFDTLYREALAASDAGRDVEAAATLLRIDPASGLFTKARLKVQELAATMARRDAAACRGLKPGASAEAAASCRRYLDYGCHSKPDDEAAAKLRRATGQGWSCPAELAPFFRTVAAAGTDPLEAISSRYAAKELRDAMASYVRGDLEGALRATGKLRRASGASEANARLAVVLGRYKEGDAALRAGRLGEARVSFDAALAADAELVPAEVRSFHAGDMRRRLADALSEAARASFERQQHVEAFQQWSAGLAYQPALPSALDGLARLERAASGWMAGEPGCDAARKALRVTVASPPSAAHGRAAGLLEGACRE